MDMGWSELRELVMDREAWHAAVFRCLYLSFSPLFFTSLLLTAICKASPDSHFAFLHFFSMGMVLIPVSSTMSWTNLDIPNTDSEPGKTRKLVKGNLLDMPHKWSEVSQLCPTLCDPMDYGLPGSSLHGIFQAIVLEWIAISMGFSRQ